MKFHAFAEVFPLLSEDNLTELAEDIRANGLREPIWLLDGQVLDGRNRFLACQKAKVKPRYRDYTGNDPVKFVVSLNIHRRHLTDAQRAYAAAKISTLSKGRRELNPPNDGFNSVTQEQAAELLSTNIRAVQRAKKVQEEGSAALNKAFQAGEVSLSRAALVVDLPKSEQLAAAKAEPEFKVADYDEQEDTEASDRAQRDWSERIDTAMAADDKLAAAFTEIKTQAGLIATLTGSRDHYQNQAGEATRLLKAEQRKSARLQKLCDKQTKELADLKSTPRASAQHEETRQHA